MKCSNDKLLKTIFFLPVFPKGGCERVVSILSDQFIKRGVNVDLVLLYDDYLAYPLPSEVNIYGSFCRSISTVEIIKKLRSYIKDECQKYRVVLIPLLYPTYQYVTLAAWGLDVPRIMSERCNPNSKAREFKLKIKNQFFYALADKCIFQTEEARGFYKFVPDNRAVFINNPITPVPYKWIGDLSSHKIVAVGRLEEQKNFHLAIDIISSLKDRYSDITLDIYGMGPLEGCLKEYAESLGIGDRVRLCGVANDIVKRITEYSLFLQTSDYEGISNAVLEAMSVGMPIVATSTAGCKEMLRDKYGCLFPIKDKDKACEKIISLFDNEAFAREMANNAYIESLKYSPQEITDQWLKVIEDVLR